VSLLKHLTELVDTDLIDDSPNAALVACVLVWLDDNVPVFCSLLAGDSKVLFIRVIFLSSLSEIPSSNRPSPVEGNEIMCRRNKIDYSDFISVYATKQLTVKNLGKSVAVS